MRFRPLKHDVTDVPTRLNLEWLTSETIPVYDNATHKIITGIKMVTGKGTTDASAYTLDVALQNEEVFDAKDSYIVLFSVEGGNQTQNRDYVTYTANNQFTIYIDAAAAKNVRWLAIGY